MNWKPCDCETCQQNPGGPWLIPSDQADGDHANGSPPDEWVEVAVEKRA
jgi:hypothetical protein